MILPSADFQAPNAKRIRTTVPGTRTSGISAGSTGFPLLSNTAGWIARRREGEAKSSGLKFGTAAAG
jgi:hypothetical protein